MPRPKAITVGYDPEIDDERRRRRYSAGVDVAGQTLADSLPFSFVVRAVGWIALAFCLGGQAALVVIFSTAIAITSSSHLWSPSSISLVRAAYALFGSVADDIDQMCGVGAVILVFLTLREGYYSGRSLLGSYLPCVGAVASLGLLIEAVHLRIAAYYSGTRNISQFLRTLLALTEVQVVVLFVVAFGLSWLQNTTSKPNQTHSS